MMFPTQQQRKVKYHYSLLNEGSSTPVIQRRNIGVINYKTGRITLDPINIVSGKTKDNVQILEISAHLNQMISLDYKIFTCN